MLGLLNEEPDYGYHLKQRFEERVGEVWRLNLGQVYQTLRSLERDGLIRRTGDEDTELEDEQAAARRRYELTARGTRTLEAWLRRKPSSPQPLRDELLIRLLVLEPTRRGEALDRIKAQEQVYSRHLVRLLARKRKIPHTNEGAEFVASLGLEAAIGHANAHLRWLEYCRLRIEGGLASAPSTSAPSTSEGPGSDVADATAASPSELRVDDDARAEDGGGRAVNAEPRQARGWTSVVRGVRGGRRGM